MLRKLKSITGYQGEELPERTVEEMKQSIEQYKQKVEECVEANENLGMYYKMLALEYVDREMYGLALEHFENAINIYPENKILFYWSGVCAGRMSKSTVKEEEKQELLKTAEQYYLRAIELDRDYVDALYGLSILYVFEMDRIAEAEPLLKRILQRESRNVDAMFLLARVYAATGRIDNAVDMYDEIIDTTGNEEEKNKARQFKQQLSKGDYEF
jgi:tetratricopeptide (TPR) repeat protein